MSQWKLPGFLLSMLCFIKSRVPILVQREDVVYDARLPGHKIMTAESISKQCWKVLRRSLYSQLESHTTKTIISHEGKLILKLGKEALTKKSRSFKDSEALKFIIFRTLESLSPWHDDLNEAWSLQACGLEIWFPPHEKVALIWEVCVSRGRRSLGMCL